MTTDDLSNVEKIVYCNLASCTQQLTDCKTLRLE